MAKHNGRRERLCLADSGGGQSAVAGRNQVNGGEAAAEEARQEGPRKPQTAKRLGE